MLTFDRGWVWRSSVFQSVINRIEFTGSNLQAIGKKGICLLRGFQGRCQRNRNFWRSIICWLRGFQSRCQRNGNFWLSIDQLNFGVGFNPDTSATVFRTVVSVNYATTSQDFYIPSVNIAGTFFDGDDWHSVFRFFVVVLSDRIFVDMDASYRTWRRFVPSGTGACTTRTNYRHPVDQGNYPNVANFICSMNSALD